MEEIQVDHVIDPKDDEVSQVENVNYDIKCDFETFKLLNDGEKYKGVFCKELIDRFKLKIDLARKIEEELEKNDDENNLLKKIPYWNSLYPSEAFIPLHIPGVQKATSTTPLGYTCVLYGLFSLARRTLEDVARGNARNNFSSNMFINIQHVPFQRIFLDFDIKSVEWDKEDEVIECVLDILKQCNIPTNMLKTYRYERTNKSFHLITESSFDTHTRHFLLTDINRMIAEKYSEVEPDFVDTVGVPTGRCHILPYKYLFDFELFKKASVIDVWDPLNQYTLLCDNPSSQFDVDDFKIFIGTNVNSFRSKISTVNNFFTKFENYHPDIEISSRFTSCKTFKSLIDAVVPIETIQYIDGEKVETWDNSINELYQFIYIAKLKYSDSLFNIFKNEQRQIDDSRNISIDLNCFFGEEREVIEEKDFLTKKFDVIWTEKMIKTREVIENTKDEDGIWEIVVPKLFTNLHLSNQEIGEYIYLIMFFYKKYCLAHNIDIVNLAYVDYVIEEKSGNERDVLNVGIIKHIIKLMLNQNIVSSNLAWFLRSKLYDDQNFNNRMYSAIFLLDHLGIDCEIARYNLYYYISDDICNSGDTIGEILLKSYPLNDMLYFLFENYDENVISKLAIFNTLISPEEVEEVEEPPSKKRRDDGKGDKKGDKKKKPLDSEYKTIVHYYLFYAVLNGSTTIYFDGGRYREAPSNFGLVHREYPGEPLKSVPWYRRELNGVIGIYNSFSQTFERNTPSLYTGIYVPVADVFKQYPNDIFDALDYESKCFMYTTYMKVGEFLKILRNNKTAIILLGKPINSKELPYITDKTNVLDIDMNCDMHFDSELFKILYDEPRFALLKKTFKSLAVIVCSISKKYFIDLKNRANFILFFNGTGTDDVEIEEDYSHDVNKLLEYLKDSTKNDMGLFFNRLFKTTENTRSNPNVEVKLKNLTDVNFYSTCTDELNSMSKYLILNVFNAEILGDYKWENNDEYFNEFVLVILSWFIRTPVREEFESCKFFLEISKNRNELFSQLCELYKIFFGQLIINDGITSMAKYFQRFCEATEINLDNMHFDSVYKFNRGYSRYAKEIYLGFADLMSQAQFDLDTFVDLNKILSSYTHRGNVLRRFLALLKKTNTGKNRFVERVISRIFPGGYNTGLNQKFGNNDLQNGYNSQNGHTFSVNLWSNLLMWFDEVKSLPSETKTYVNQATVSVRVLYANTRSSYNINSSIIMSSNDPPIGEDIAANLRMMPINRVFQYTECKDIKIDRVDSVLDATLKPINKIFGIQLLMEKLPALDEGYVCDIGTYLIIWNNASLFYKSFEQPMSKILSKTMNENIKEILYISSPQIFILENGYFNFTPTCSVSEDQFKSKVFEIITKNSDMFKRNEKHSNILRLLYEHIEAYRDIPGKRVFVEFLK